MTADNMGEQAHLGLIGEDDPEVVGTLIDVQVVRSLGHAARVATTLEGVDAGLPPAARARAARERGHELPPTLTAARPPTGDPPVPQRTRRSSKGNYLREVAPLARGARSIRSCGTSFPLFNQGDGGRDRPRVRAGVRARPHPAGRARAPSPAGPGVRIVTGDYLDVTPASALDLLLDGEKADGSEDETPAGRFEARVVEVSAPPRGAARALATGDRIFMNVARKSASRGCPGTSIARRFISRDSSAASFAGAAASRERRSSLASVNFARSPLKFERRRLNCERARWPGKRRGRPGEDGGERARLASLSVTQRRYAS